MSSQTYSDRPAIDATDALRDAVVAVTEKSFFSYADICGPGQFAERAAELGDTPAWLHAAVPFSGAMNGAIEIEVPEELAQRLLASFTGRLPDDDESLGLHVVDSVGELANMICGCWLTQYSPSTPVDLSPPRVVRRVGVLDRPPVTAGATLDHVCAYIDDWPVRVTLATSAQP